MGRCWCSQFTIQNPVHVQQLTLFHFQSPGCHGWGGGGPGFQRPSSAPRPGRLSPHARGTGSSEAPGSPPFPPSASRWGRPLPCSAGRRAGRRGWAASAAPPSITWPERHKNNSFGQGRDLRTGNPGSQLQPRPHGGEFSRILWEAEPPAVADTGASPAAPAWDTPAPPQL